MDRPPRNPNVERLVSRRLISFSYLQIGLLQTAAGFLAFMTVLNDYGYQWSNLLGLGVRWPVNPLICNPQLDNGATWVANCGFGCGEPAKSLNGLSTLYGAASDAGQFCKDGCPIPFNVRFHAKLIFQIKLYFHKFIGPVDDKSACIALILQGTADPFIEFSEYGFRGYAQDVLGSSYAAQAVCGRTCAWYADLAADLKQSMLQAHQQFLARLAVGAIDVNDPFSYAANASLSLLLSPADVQLFDAYCATPNASSYGFAGRDLAYKDKVAPQGGYYWWNGMVQYWPNMENQGSVLRTAQTAYFAGVVVARTADLLICKTRKESIFTQGLRNRVLNAGLFAMLLIVCLISYVPFLRIVWGTRPLFVLYLFMGLPYTAFIFVYDEVRKYIMRLQPKGWVFRNTYW